MNNGLEMVSYLLYAGLGFSVLSFVLLMFGLIQKKEPTPIFEQIVNDDNYSDEDFDDDYQDESEREDSKPKKEKKPLFSFFGKKNKAAKEVDEEDFEFDDADDDNENADFEDEVDDEYERDFDLNVSTDSVFGNKKRSSYTDFNFDDYTDEKTKDDEGEFEFSFEDDGDNGFKIKKYDEKELNKLDDENYDEEAEMIKRMEFINNQFKK